MAKYKIGETLISKTDVEATKVFGEKVIIPKGNKVIIGADRLAHHIKTGMIQPLKEDDIIEGYDAEGIADFIFGYLETNFPLREFFEDYDLERDDYREEIQYALEELGF